MCRKECRSNRVENKRQFRRNEYGLLFADPHSAMRGKNEFRVHLYITLKVTSDLRLQLTDTKSKSTYPSESEAAKEVHFLTMEGVLGTVNVKESVFWSIVKITPLFNYLFKDILANVFF